MSRELVRALGCIVLAAGVAVMPVFLTVHHLRPIAKGRRQRTLFSIELCDNREADSADSQTCVRTDSQERNSLVHLRNLLGGAVQQALLFFGFKCEPISWLINAPSLFSSEFVRLNV